MQMAAKIVYYGPGLCGKTTNLHHIYGRTSPDSRGEMVSLETETDRTLFFDLLPLDVGMIGGFKTRVQLYTVPGQVFYNTTRKLVLKGVDGIVFVADSQRAMRDANAESLLNLRSNLQEIGVELDDLPFVFQYNKRDLGSILTLQELEDSLNAERNHESYEACAVLGQGVFETLKAISKLTLRSLKAKMVGEDRSTRPAYPSGDDAAAADAAEIVPPGAGAAPGSQPAGDETAGAAAPPPEESGAEVLFADSPESAPMASSEAPPGSAPFAETPVEIKHVRVRSNIDILAELDKLRRNATSQPASSRSARRPSSGISIDDLLANSLNHRKEISRAFEMELPRKDLARGHQITVALRLEDSQKKAIGEKKSFSIEINSKPDIEKLLLSLKFDIHGK